MTATPALTRYFLGLDLGQAADFSALAVLEQTRPAPGAEASYACRHLHRWPLATPYPRIVDDVAAVVGQLPHPTLAIDGTGCGRAVVDLFRRRPMRASLRPILITAGSAVTRDEQGYTHVAKVQLVSVLQVLLQGRRFKFAKGLSLAKIAEAELANYKVKVTLAQHETFAGDWRAGQHDDLCLAIMLAAYLPSRPAPGSPVAGGTRGPVSPPGAVGPRPGWGAAQGAWWAWGPMD